LDAPKEKTMQKKAAFAKNIQKQFSNWFVHGTFPHLPSFNPDTINTLSYIPEGGRGTYIWSSPQHGQASQRFEFENLLARKAPCYTGLFSNLPILNWSPHPILNKWWVL
jgi:hypothetical protein